jgi:hypothetical protein
MVKYVRKKKQSNLRSHRTATERVRLIKEHPACGGVAFVCGEIASRPFYFQIAATSANGGVWILAQKKCWSTRRSN